MRNDPFEQLYARPGFMIRRANQIAVSVFLEETGAFRVTTTQYGILYVLKQRPGLDQISVARLLGLDRSTTGMVLRKLELAGYVGRGIGIDDRRRRSLQLTRAGEKMLQRLAGPARRAKMRILSAFTPAERTVFLRMLDKLARTFNETTRVPLEGHRSTGRKAPPKRREQTKRR